MAASMENVYSSVFQTFTAGNSSLAESEDIAGTLNESQLLTGKNTNNLQEILSFVHDSLTKTKQRLKGLQLLKVIVCQCSTDVFQHNAERWIRLLFQILQGHNAVEVYRSTLQVLGDIFEHARNFTDVSRMIVNNVIQELLPILLKPYTPKVLIDNIACINRCIQTFPGPLGPFKGKIEALVYSELEINTKSTAIYKCFALLNQCGPGGTKGIKHTESWCKQCNDLLGSLEITLGSLYEGFETDKLDDGKECLPMSKTSNPLETNPLSSMKSRWITLCGCLEALLGLENDATVRIPVNRIVELICRVLAVNCKMVLSKPTSERMLLASYLTIIHKAGLSVLEQLVITCRKNLLPYCAVITSVLSQELLWSKSTNIGFNMTFGLLREKVYTVMSVWLRTLDGCAGVGQESKTWVEQILHDCSPYTESFTLKTSPNNSKNPDEMPKKKKKKGYHEISQGISTQKKVHLDANCRLVQAGLEALYWLITTNGPQLDRKSIQAIQSFIIKTLLTIQQSIEKQSPIPYSKPGCRKSLYRVLLACVINTNPQAPPPTQCALRIFSNGQIDKNLQVSSFCIEALRICEVVIHPRAPVLNGPIICENVLRIGTEPELTDKTQVIDIENVMDSETSSVDNVNDKSSLKRPFSCDGNVSDIGNRKVMKLQSESDDRLNKSVHEENTEENGINIVSEKSIVTISDIDGAKHKESTQTSVDKGSLKRYEEKMETVDSESDDDDDELVDKSDDMNENKRDNEGSSDVKDGIEPGVDAEVYVASKLDKEVLSAKGDNMEEEEEEVSEEDVEEKLDEDDNALEEGASIDATRDLTEGEEKNDEEVATMMLAFVDASPDSD